MTGQPEAAPPPDATSGEWYHDPKWARIRDDREAGADYLWAHYDALLARYPNEEIAVYRDRVVFHATESSEFGRLLEDYLARTDMHPSSLELHYMDPDPPLLAL